VKKRAVSASELLEAALARCEQRNPAVNAVVIPMFEQARTAAKAEVPKGAFEGVPFLLKDLHLNVPGVRTTNGSSLSRATCPRTKRFHRAMPRRAVVFGKSASPGSVSPHDRVARVRATKNP
jgi:Asp-tRNA(Asn)/Glu-tRNA(Gln) amidotransferase A subunit family amidase